MIFFKHNSKKINILGDIFIKHCDKCSLDSIWQLCTINYSITIFNVPIITYNKVYCIKCNNCDNFIKLNEDTFSQLVIELNNSSNYIYEQNIFYSQKIKARND